MPRMNQPGTQIKSVRPAPRPSRSSICHLLLPSQSTFDTCAGYCSRPSLTFPVSPFSHYSCYRLTNVSIVRTKKGGKRFEVWWIRPRLCLGLTGAEQSLRVSLGSVSAFFLTKGYTADFALSPPYDPPRMPFETLSTLPSSYDNLFAYLTCPNITGK